MGHPRSLVTRFFDGAEQDPKVIQADRRQGVFQKDFISFSQCIDLAASLGACTKKCCQIRYNL